MLLTRQLRECFWLKANVNTQLLKQLSFGPRNEHGTSADKQRTKPSSYNQFGGRKYLCNILAFNLVIYGKYIGELHEGLYLISPTNCTVYKMTVAQKAGSVDGDEEIRTSSANFLKEGI